MEPPNVTWRDEDLDFSTPCVREFGIPDDSSPHQSQVHLDDPPQQSQDQSNATTLPLLKLVDWDPEAAYDETPPTCIHYFVEWRLLVRKKKTLSKVATSTEQDIVLTPDAYWEMILKPKLAKHIQKTESDTGDKLKPDATNITICVRDRNESDVNRPFLEQDIRWHEVEEQLVRWSHLFLEGRRLTLKIDLIYKKEQSESADTSHNEKGRDSKTRRQYRAAQADPVTSAWRAIFPVLECPGAGCKLGPYCWRDPETGTRYNVAMKILDRIRQKVESGEIESFESHADVPKYLQDEIRHAAERKGDPESPSKRKQHNLPPINIIMPGADGPQRPHKRTRLAVKRNQAIKPYLDWHCSHVDDPEWERNFLAIADITNKAFIDLEIMEEHSKRFLEFFISKQIPEGIAYQWVTMVSEYKNSVKGG